MQFFNEIDRLLPDVRTVEEVCLLSRLGEGMLAHHADVEQNLAFVALDQALAENGELKQLNQDHEEIDVCLRKAAVAADLTKALRLPKMGLKASRAHFSREEESVFPLFDKKFSPEALTAPAAGDAPSVPSLGEKDAAHAYPQSAAVQTVTGNLSPRESFPGL